MSLVIKLLNQPMMVVSRVNLALNASVIFRIRKCLPSNAILSHAHDQKHQGQNDHGDRAHGEQNQRQRGKASLTRPMRVSQCLVAERLHALAHRFESVNHGWQCTPVHSGVRKCLGGAL